MVNQTTFRQCSGDQTGILWAVCNKTGQWSITSNNCTLRVIQDLTDRAKVILWLPVKDNGIFVNGWLLTLSALIFFPFYHQYLDIEEVPMFAANLSNAVENNSEIITTNPVNLLKVVDLLSSLATVSKTQSFVVDKNMMVVCICIFIFTISWRFIWSCD